MRARDERGGVAVLTAAAVAVLVAIAAFAVDLGMQRVVRSDMQALADVVALDAARLLDGRTAAEIVAGTDAPRSLDEAVQASVEANSTTLGRVDDVSATLIFLTAGPLGNMVPVTQNGAVVEATGTALPDAVLVDAAGSVDFAFRSGSGGASRQALASASPFACFRLGSYAASLKTGDAEVIDVFESLVGDSLDVQLKAVGYMGLADAYVTLESLAAELGAGSADELVNLRNVKLADLLEASAAVLSSEGNTSAAAVMAGLATSVANDLTLDVADILAVGQGAALQGSINALDLLAASAFAANESQLLKSGVLWKEPHVSSGDVQLKVVEAPTQACGPPGPETVATTSQMELTADLGFALPNTIAGLSASIPTDTSNKKGTLSLRAVLAGASGTLTGITCGAGTSAADFEETRVRIDSRLSTLSASLPFRLTGEIDTSTIVPPNVITSAITGLLGTVTTKLKLDLRMTAAFGLSHPANTGTGDTLYTVPDHTYEEPEPSLGSGDYVTMPGAGVVIDGVASTASLEITRKYLGVTTKSSIVLDLANLSLVSIQTQAGNSFVGSSVGAVIDTANELLAPLSRLLGLRVNGADLFGVPRPNCSVPQLVG
jgi:uncharacterized membrane protein